MITAVDTNVVALWERDDALNSTAQSALDAAFARGKLVISGAVFPNCWRCLAERKRLLKNF
jgi:hypothetical protein